MAKFNIEVELDWLHEDDTVDEEIYKQVISGIQDRLTRNIESKMEEKLTNKRRSRKGNRNLLGKCNG